MAVLNSTDTNSMRFAMHCLTLDSLNGDPDYRAIPREVAVEWLRLAEGRNRAQEPTYLFLSWLWRDHAWRSPAATGWLG
jgi:hypothetical protein